MKKNKVIAAKNFPTRLPFATTALLVMAMDYYKAPSWLYGVAGTIVVIVWVIGIVGLIKEQRVDIFNKEEE